MVELGARHIVYAVVVTVAIWSLITFLFCISILIITASVILAAVYSSLRKRWTERPEKGTIWADDKGALRRNNIRMAVVLVVAILVTAYALAFVKDYISDSESWIRHSYSVSIDALTTDAYTVMCPVPCDSDGTVYEGFLDELEVVDGVAVLTLLDTEHGQALRIQGQGDLELEWSASWSIDGERFWKMTMTEGSEEETATSWVYSDNEGMIVELDHSSRYKEMGRLFSSEGETYYRFTVEPEGVGWETVGVEFGEWFS